MSCCHVVLHGAPAPAPTPTVVAAAAVSRPCRGARKIPLPRRAQSIGAVVASLKCRVWDAGESRRPGQFTYNSSSQTERKAPSLRRGWILGRNRDNPDNGLEVLLGRTTATEKQQQNKQEQEQEQELPYSSSSSSSCYQIRSESSSSEIVDEEEFLFEGGDTLNRTTTIGNGDDDGRMSKNESALALGRDSPAGLVGGSGFREKALIPAYVRGPKIDKKSFIRVYYVSALRVPAQESWSLAFELRDHLLNWPRVSNIGRVAGDDVDPDLAVFFTKSSSATAAAQGTEKETSSNVDGDAAVRAAVFDESSNSETRQRRRRRGLPPPANGSTRGRKKKEDVACTMLEELVSAEEDGKFYKQRDDVSNRAVDGVGAALHTPLLQKWTGPTRLLLLDEKHAGKDISELPLALQTVCSKFRHNDVPTASDVVKCRLTIFYEYWTMDEVLQELLPAEASTPVSFDRIGHVAELKLHYQHLPFRHLIAQVTLDKHKPLVRSVVFRRSVPHSKKYAVQVELLVGTTSLVTTGWENGIPYRVDLSSMTWDLRLSLERQRLLGLFSKDDIVCDVCAGVGLITIPASMKVRRVFANNVNPYAHNCLAKNIVDNNVSGRVELFNQDIQRFLSAIFYLERPLPITQLVMSYPVDDSAEFLEFFWGLFDQRTWPCRSLPRVHLYGISRTSYPEEDFSKQITEAIQTTPFDISVRRVVEETSGGWIMYASFVLPQHVCFHQFI